MVLITVATTKNRLQANALKYEQSERFVVKAKDYFTQNVDRAFA